MGGGTDVRYIYAVLHFQISHKFSRYFGPRSLFSLFVRCYCTKITKANLGFQKIINCHENCNLQSFFMIFNSFLASNIGLHTAVPPISLCMWMILDDVSPGRCEDEVTVVSLTKVTSPSRFVN